MPAKTAVARKSELGPGQMKIIAAAGKRIALCNVGGEFFAIEDLCTHDDGPLGEGTLRGAEVECPRHGARFDVKTGAAMSMPAVVPVRTFPVLVEGDEIFIEAGS